MSAPDARAQIAGLVFAALLVDPAGEVHEANAAAENMLGFSAKRMVGRSLTDVVRVEDERVLRLLDDAATPIVARGLTLRLGEGDGRVNMTVSPLTQFGGWRVITLSDAGQESMASQHDEAHSAGAPAILAHEIKNPLAAIKGAAQLLARRCEDKEKDLAQLISGEADRIASLIDRMQTLGSATSAPREAFNLHEAVRNALTTLQHGEAPFPPVAEEFDPSLPDVMGNREALEQVLINLLSNARDVLQDRDDAAITVTTRFVSGRFFNAIRPGRNVRLPIELIVSDNGPGIPTHLQERIFEPFVSTKSQGQGLGLALVRKLVLDMEGRITCQRDKSHGLTHFHVHLPMAPIEKVTA